MIGEGWLTRSSPHLLTLKIGDFQETNVFVHDEAVDFVKQEHSHEGQFEPEQITWMLG